MCVACLFLPVYKSLIQFIKISLLVVLRKLLQFYILYESPKRKVFKLAGTHKTQASLEVVFILVEKRTGIVVGHLLHSLQRGRPACCAVLESNRVDKEDADGSLPFAALSCIPYK